MTKEEMQERLIIFAVNISEIVERLPKSNYSIYLGNQLLRSASSPALNYAEACAAESDKDLLHKDKIILKELRESLVILKIIKRKKYLESFTLENSLNENNELISIFVKACEAIKYKILAAKRTRQSKISNNQ